MQLSSNGRISYCLYQGKSKQQIISSPNYYAEYAASAEPTLT